MSGKPMSAPISWAHLVMLIAILWCGIMLESSPCHAAEAVKAVATDQPTLPILIQGVLLGYDGKPVNEGFLMLQGNPHLNALTGYDGRFRIEGNAWELPDSRFWPRGPVRKSRRP